MKLSDSTLDPDSMLDLEALHRALENEFARLNAAHFAGRLALPEIVLSRRKTYGGYYQPARHRIVLSWQAYGEHGWDEILNTFRHEVAHIVHQNHARPFWLLAQQMGVTRRHAAAPLVPPPRPFVYACPACGRQWRRGRRLRHPSSCGSCDTRYNPCFVLHPVAR